MRTLAAAFAQRPDLRAAFTVVYDAEALYAPRLAQALQLEGKPMPAEREAEELAAEFALARGADLIVSVGPGEARALAVGTGREVFVLGFTSLREPTPADFSARRNFGFVGPMRLLSPNEDAILWYAANVLREVAARTGAGLRVCGLVENSMLPIYAGPKFQLVGALDDLSPFFNAIRVFVAPTRYAAGLPQKLIDAASAGVPIVATSLLAGQLGWRDGVELLVADEPRAFAEACARLYADAELWAALRENARVRIAEVYGPGCFARELDRIMAALADRPPRHTAPAER
jgi:glycosyltransferase involved in cell wall biosynthesis